jgi:uncharacterized protein YcbX
MRIASLHIYPIKGTRAVDVDRARFEQRGLEGDRRWVVVDAAGQFITQRSHPRLAQISATPIRTGLRLSAPRADELLVDRPPGSERIEVTVWEHRVNAALADAHAGTWLSNFFGEELRLAYMDGASERLKRGIWTEAPLPISFADAYPALITTTGSLAALNTEIARRGLTPVPMTRFRPNVVIDCDEPWQEDTWKTLRLGALEVDLVKPCDRCVVTTKDQISGESMGEEPIVSLTRLRMSDDPRIKGVLFGWNSAPRDTGEVAVGDRVEILDERREGFPIRRV